MGHPAPGDGVREGIQRSLLQESQRDLKDRSGKIECRVQE